MSRIQGDSRGGRARWLRLSLRAQGVAVLVVPLAALFAALSAICVAEADVRDADRAVVYSYGAQSELLHLRGSLLDAQMATNGFVTTGRTEWLPRFQSSRRSLGEGLARLASAKGGNREDAEDIVEIRRLANEGISAFAAAQIAVPALRSAFLDRGRSAAEQLQEHIAVLGAREDSRFNQARYDRDLKRQRLFRIVLLCGIVGPLGALFVHLLLAGRLVRRIQGVQENARRLAHGLPLKGFPPGTDEIADLARQIEDAAVLLNFRERELQESEGRYRDLFDRAPVPYEETDTGGVVRRFNQAVCSLLQSKPDQILGCKAWDFVASDQRDAFRESMLKRIATGTEVGPFECEYQLEDGSSIMVEIRENLIRNERGEVAGTCRSLTDVTERNLAAMAARKVEQYAMELRNKNEQLARALDAARSATEAKSRFLASVSHELRTPLNGIIGFSELMYDGKVGPLSEDQRDCLSDILTSSRHLLELISDILDLSKVEAGKMEFHPEPTGIDVLVDEVRDVIRPLAEKKDLRLSSTVPAGLTAIIDPGRFKQVLYNYISNAVKFTPAGGAVEVRVEVIQGDRFRLEVQDTGIGIPAVEISRLFQEFQQLPNSRKAEQGTGLGLALTRHIVEAQGGSVAVRSTPGTGSVFSAVLPLDTRSHAAVKTV
jgi:PAS domain S-box-containing protein